MDKNPKTNPKNQRPTLNPNNMPNQLINSASPYLLQHAHNPVNWHMWCDEALQKAVEEDKPILVSIGYSSCHWCHVMEHESFEDQATAAVMNEFFVNIKIDREERPDLDHIYMDALQALTGSGGWPLNVFLTPQLKPFYGGTYFPPVAAHGRMSWTDTLHAIHNAYTQRKDEIVEQANKLTEYINNSNSFAKNKAKTNAEITNETFDIIAKNILQNADTVWGGFGKAPKFPQTFSIQFLLRHYHFTKDETCLKQALLSLSKMILGGLYDQVGGGFARYSTDEKWIAPHFEKMLYDNALLIGVIAEAYQITKNGFYKETLEQTLAFVEREMMSKEHAFYSALDADSEGIEGKFYTWQKTEIDELLDEHATLFCEVYNISEKGNWEHTNILWLNQTIDELAQQKNINSNELHAMLQNCEQILLKARDKRIRPMLDDKTLCSWNCLMIIGYCKAFAATGNNQYKEIAEKNLQFILNKMFVAGKLMHCFKNGDAYNNAFAEDYAYLTWALIQLQEITGKQEYLVKAKAMLDEVVEQFSTEEENFFYYTAANQANLIARKVDVYDGATPSPNAVLAYCMYYLAVVFDDGKLRKRYLNIISNLLPAIEKHPTSFGAWAMTLQQYFFCKEIVVTNCTSEVIIHKINNQYIPCKILIAANNSNSFSLPILNEKIVEKHPIFYLCKNYTCLPPETDLTKFLHLCNI